MIRIVQQLPIMVLMVIGIRWPNTWVILGVITGASTVAYVVGYLEGRLETK